MTALLKSTFSLHQLLTECCDVNPEPPRPKLSSLQEEGKESLRSSLHKAKQSRVAFYQHRLGSSLKCVLMSSSGTRQHLSWEGKKSRKYELKWIKKKSKPIKKKKARWLQSTSSEKSFYCFHLFSFMLSEIKNHRFFGRYPKTLMVPCNWKPPDFPRAPHTLIQPASVRQKPHNFSPADSDFSTWTHTHTHTELWFPSSSYCVIFKNT